MEFAANLMYLFGGVITLAYLGIFFIQGYLMVRGWFNGENDWDWILFLIFIGLVVHILGRLLLASMHKEASIL